MATIHKNIDESEISKFETVASRWWDREGEFGALHDINETRVRYINDRAGLAGKQVLDIGCGGGILSEAMAEVGAEVTGIDAGKGPLDIARSHMVEKGLKIDYRQVTAEAFAVSHSQRYDIITCLELLEHVPPKAMVHNQSLQRAGQARRACLFCNPQPQPAVIPAGNRSSGIPSRIGTQRNASAQPVYQTFGNDRMGRSGSTHLKECLRTFIHSPVTPLHSRRTVLRELYGAFFSARQPPNIIGAHVNIWFYFLVS